MDTDISIDLIVYKQTKAQVDNCYFGHHAKTTPRGIHIPSDQTLVSSTNSFINRVKLGGSINRLPMCVKAGEVVR